MGNVDKRAKRAKQKVKLARQQKQQSQQAKDTYSFSPEMIELFKGSSSFHMDLSRSDTGLAIIKIMVINVPVLRYPLVVFRNLCHFGKMSKTGMT